MGDRVCFGLHDSSVSRSVLSIKNVYLKYFIYLHGALGSEKVYLPVAGGKQKFVVVG